MFGLNQASIQECVIEYEPQHVISNNVKFWQV